MIFKMCHKKLQSFIQNHKQQKCSESAQEWRIVVSTNYCARKSQSIIIIQKAKRKKLILIFVSVIVVSVIFVSVIFISEHFNKFEASKKVNKDLLKELFHCLLCLF